MGGRGGSSGFKAQNKSAIGSEKPITVDIMYRNGNYYGEVFSVKQTSDGVLEVNYNSNTEWEKESRTTSTVHHTLNAGIYNTSNRVNQYGAYSEYGSHNINWDKVKEVSGKTYHLGAMLREKGFRWDKNKKTWVKG